LDPVVPGSTIPVTISTGTKLIPAVNLLMQRESGRQSCLKIDLFSGDGVVEI
jgi:hypothetical protein